MARLARLLPSLMPNDPAFTDLDWTQLQGTTLEGGFELESILSAEQHHAAFRVRVLGDSAANAYANVYPLDSAAAEEQVALWQQLRRLNGANLSLPLGAGQVIIGGTTFAFVVLRRPDEKLDAILAERALTPQEAGECLSAMTTALEQLHAGGLVHGCLAPEHIFSIGESVRLSTECARVSGSKPLLPHVQARYRAPESAHENLTPQADIWCLGATLVEILTQQPGREGLPESESLPAPFNGIARKCLEADPAARPQLGQIEALYRGRGSASQAQPAAAAAAGAAGATSPAAASHVSSRPSSSVGASEWLPLRSNLTPRSAAPAKPIGVDHQKTRPVWPYLAAALIALLAIWLWPRHRAQAPAATVAQSATASQSRTIPAAEAPNTNAQSAPHPTPLAAASKPASAGRGQIWRVVLYAYTRESDAANKARAINKQHPDLNAGTFSPSGGGPYLVVAGGNLSHDQASNLLQRVRSLGLPRDSYIQNYAQ